MPNDKFIYKSYLTEEGKKNKPMLSSVGGDRKKLFGHVENLSFFLKHIFDGNFCTSLYTR